MTCLNIVVLPVGAGAGVPPNRLPPVAGEGADNPNPGAGVGVPVAANNPEAEISAQAFVRFTILILVQKAHRS